MYNGTLFIHSWLRWVVLVLAIVVIVRSFMGWFGSKSYTASDNRLAVFFIASMHLQLVLGLILYFIYSPVGLSAFDAGMGAVMKNSALRFWAVEHLVTMILAVVLAQVGRTRAKKAVAALKKHRNMAIFTTISILLVLSRIPWDQAGRMFRGLN